MMKKNGFTLAEVLITLAIIGVVATMTLPALITNIGEQQYISGFKKGINTLTEAGQMNMALEGFDYGTLDDDSIARKDVERDEKSLYAILFKRTSIDIMRSVNASEGEGLPDTIADNVTVYFKDGSAISYNANGTVADPGHAHFNTIFSDGLPHGIPILFDVNGDKNPNLLSNCQNNVNMKTNIAVSDAESGQDAKTACLNNNRVIRDRFGIRLRGSLAVPNGAASRWAFEK